MKHQHTRNPAAGELSVRSVWPTAAAQLHLADRSAGGRFDWA